MDSQIRNFKDFLSLYNKVTELCFTGCVDNFFSRNLAPNENDCVDKCVTKFARFNQSMMNVYVEVQTDINSRRMEELEVTAKEAEAKAVAAAAEAAPAVVTPTEAPAAIDIQPSDNTSTSIGVVVDNATNAS